MQVVERRVLVGRDVTVEPLDHGHAGDLCEITDPALYQYLFEAPDGFDEWFERAVLSRDPLYYAVVVDGRALGRVAIMRIDLANGVAEIGSILWGPELARTRGATEAVYLLAGHLFSLGVRRVEWKCDNLNEASKAAAVRLGFTFEGVFRQHMIVKGENRDTAWFSLLDHEWPARRRALRTWLDPDNFDAAGVQRSALSAFA